MKSRDFIDVIGPAVRTDDHRRLARWDADDFSEVTGSKWAIDAA